MNFGVIIFVTTGRQTESRAHEPTVQLHKWAKFFYYKRTLALKYLIVTSEYAVESVDIGMP